MNQVNIGSFFWLYVEYSKELRSLQTPVPKEPQYCADWECNFHESPTACYSDFGPIFDENNNGRSMKLSSIFIGLFDHWDKTDLIYLNNADEYGYQDVKYYYSVSYLINISLECVYGQTYPLLGGGT